MTESSSYNSLPPLRPAPLGSLAVIQIAGPDARGFLQGQLSCDVRRLSPQRALLGCCNSAQGRVQALATLIEHRGAVVAVTAAALAVRLEARLRGYVLRAKVELTVNSGLALAPLTRAEAAGLVGEAPGVPGECSTREDLTVMRWWGVDERWLLLAPAAALTGGPDGLADLHWRQADVACGIPQVHPQTHEFFVAQMLNLDLLGGIAFDKGCYTGQEIIARTQYRGTIKRRMLRFSAHCNPPAPGTRVLTGGVHAGEVVEACIPASGAGSCELLAVVSLDRAADPLTLDGIPDSGLTPLTLPYVVPQTQAG